MDEIVADNSLIKAIEKRTKLNHEIKNQVLTYFERIEVDKDHQLLREDQYANKLYFLESGVVRTYYYHKDKEITSWFYEKDQFFTSWNSFIKSNPSFEYIETIQNCIVYSITKEKYNRLLNSHPKLEKFGRLLMEEQLAYVDAYFKGVLFMTAKEKYDLLLSYFTDITNKVNLGHIASFLGITQETLSRLRKQK